MFRQRLVLELIVSIACFHALMSFARAGAWLAPPGQGDIITTFSFSDSTRYFDNQRRLVPVSAYRKFELGTYIEYGATDWLTIVATPSIDRIQSAPSPGLTQTTTGIGDTAIGTRLKVYQTSNLIFSVQGLLRPPLGLQINSADQGYTHSHIWTGEVRALLGYSARIWGFDSFADLETGYRWNDTTTPDEWRTDLTLGVHVTKDFQFLGQNFVAISDGRSLSNPSYYWDKGQISGVYAFNAAWSGQVGYFLTLAGRNAGREMGPILSAWYRF